ncbi:hypothetical protein EHQ46_03700 [Leptospira yanagawae]|uniref:NAD glycohydrolase translocation F5/8 type C domain-containing protein n=1 Tax=Leptospira yanagawae TaxID=293069 RepID=A0ABY2M4W1_9LEPT|nr:hypothetical protein [Leptospira yanagawae]TGL24234.1 hypothetical protein EHQ46_03700 [Leptospira yanagawae]
MKYKKIYTLTFLLLSFGNLHGDTEIIYEYLNGDKLKDINYLEYSLIHILDKSEKAWCFKHNDPYTWAFKGFNLDFKEKTKIKDIFIKNGLSEKKLFKSNNRVKKFTIYKFNNDHNWEKIQTFDVKDHDKIQRFSLKKEIMERTLAFNVEEIYSNNPSSPTCITEISFSKPILLPEKKQSSMRILKNSKIRIDEMNLTLLSNGNIEGDGEGYCLCRCYFVSGNWRNISNTQAFLHINMKMSKSCGKEEYEEGDDFYDIFRFTNKID